MQDMCNANKVKIKFGEKTMWENKLKYLIQSLLSLQ